MTSPIVAYEPSSSDTDDEASIGSERGALDKTLDEKGKEQLSEELQLEKDPPESRTEQNFSEEKREIDAADSTLVSSLPGLKPHPMTKAASTGRFKAMMGPKKKGQSDSEGPNRRSPASSLHSIFAPGSSRHGSPPPKPMKASDREHLRRQNTTKAEDADSARAKVARFFEKTALGEMDSDFPTFAKKELVLGKFLGRGGFSDVEEIRGVVSFGKQPKLRRSDSLALEDKESRKFIAEHCIRPSGDARYALKRLRRDLTNEASELLWAGIVDLAIETRFLNQLEHPNIIKLRAIASCDPISPEYFLVLDRLYDTLQTRLLKWRHKNQRAKTIVGRLTDYRGIKRKDFLQERLAAAYDLSSAVDFLADRRICHRDVKPENIGFDIRGDIKIFDFGLARELPEDEQFPDGTYKLSHMTGSLRYMAPEVARGERYNQACDTYSLTIVIWEMLALQRPYNNFKNEQVFARRVFQEGVRPPIKMNWSKTCKDLLQGGWHRNVKERYTTKKLNGLLRAEVILLRHGDDSGLDHKQRRSTFVFEHIKEKRPFSGMNLPALNSRVHRATAAPFWSAPADLET